MVVRTHVLHWIGVSGLTVFPFIFLHPDAPASVVAHEKVHYRQQKKWALYGVGVGWVLWFLLYLLVLPAGWNPFRYRWEIEAFEKGEGYHPHFTHHLLKRKPYWLWRHKDPKP